MKHLLKIEDFDAEQILALLHQAQCYINEGQHKHGGLTTLSGKTFMNLFFENSTRTRVSFELAAKRLGADVVNIDLATSATAKGETVLDTVLTLQAMYCDFFVIRHADNGMPAFIAEHVEPHVHVINAGDGVHAHPSQALLDLLTIQQTKPAMQNLSVAIIGDIAHSRVANSQIAGLQMLGVTDIRLCAPKAFMPSELSHKALSLDTSIDNALRDADVIITLRIQKERMQKTELVDIIDYHNQYGLTERRLQLAKPDAIILHPGPMNRGIEIDSNLADGPQSRIKTQVSNGVAVRMAILHYLGA